MTEYVYDLNTMHQQNRETGFRRKIRSIHAVNAGSSNACNMAPRKTRFGSHAVTYRVQ
jgi:hypothetical protein